MLNRIGYLPMTADLLHVGHIHAISQSLVFCRHLIIGLLNDKAIEDYKEKPPVIPFKERKAMLEYVLPFFSKHTGQTTQIVEQDNIDFTENLKKYKPDCVLSGDGWQEEERKSAEKHKCKLINFKYYPHQSTTMIKNRVRELYADI